MSTTIYTSTSHSSKWKWKIPTTPCQHCGRSLSKSHVVQCKLNPNSWRRFHKPMVMEISVIDKKYGKLIELLKQCPKCGIEFTITLREKSKRGDRKFCSYKCSNARIHSAETKKKMSTANTRDPLPAIICPQCKIKFNPAKSIRKLCSRICQHEYRKATSGRNPFCRYRQKCEFNFGIKTYPKEFDFQLLKTYGIYNSIKNPNGISRDHKISRRFGFDNKIDPWFISHPANCVLMQQTENKIKHTKCSISFDQLKKDIELWEAKYPREDFQI